jgi:hypothetical protein
MQIGILSPRSHAAHDFSMPLRVFARDLDRRGLRVSAYGTPAGALLRCDIIGIVDKYFRSSSFNRAPPRREDVLELYASKGKTVIWFDTQDSVGQTSFEVMPYVALYAKRQLLRDKDFYCGEMYARKSRTFAAYYRNVYGIQDPSPASDHGRSPRVPATREDLEKLCISWNFGLGERRRAKRWWHLLMPRRRYAVSATPPSVERDLDISYRVSYGRPPSVDFQRVETKRRLGEMARGGQYTIAYEGKIPHREYWREIRRASIVPSPFGGGEICFRDFEAFLAGAALLKPDMGHLETWPDYYRPGETYVAHSWDFRDFEAKIAMLLESEENRRQIASIGQELYLRSLSGEHEAFVEHVLSLVERAVSSGSHGA